jgi:mono/diheme cytochrome c family protein
LFSLRPVHAPGPQNTLSFPFNQRPLMALWSALFNANQRFQPLIERAPKWNRGAYLVEALGHCGECHTPRNLLEALNNRKKFAGTVQAGWRAYNITPDRRSGLGAWSDTDIARYLSSGHADGRGSAAGPMGEAVDGSLSQRLERGESGHVLRDVDGCARGQRSYGDQRRAGHFVGRAATPSRRHSGHARVQRGVLG